MAGGGDEAVWLVDGVQLSASDISSAVMDSDGVVLHFGTRTAIADPPGALAARTVGQVSISAQTAQNLRHLLARLVADVEATSGV